MSLGTPGLPFKRTRSIGLTDGFSSNDRFRNEALPLVVYGPPALLGIVLYQYFFVSNRLRSRLATVAQDRSESSLLEHASLVGLVVYYTVCMLVGHGVGIGSSYLFAIGSVGSLLALCFNDYIVERGARAPHDGRDKSVHLASYIVGQVLPILLGVEGIIGFLDLFVPLTGRLGADAPVDFIIATLTSAVGFLIIPMVRLPIAPSRHRSRLTGALESSSSPSCTGSAHPSPLDSSSS